MPTYVYACDMCGKQFEQFQSMKDDALTVCVCGQEGAVRRVVQPVGIVFKGSGWYITDSRKGDSATVASNTAKETASENTSDSPAKADASESSATSSTASDSTSTPITTPVRSSDTAKSAA